MVVRTIEILLEYVSIILCIHRIGKKKFDINVTNEKGNNVIQALLNKNWFDLVEKIINNKELMDKMGKIAEDTAIQNVEDKIFKEVKKIVKGTKKQKIYICYIVIKD